MRRNTAWWLFWGALSLIVYTYIGFPIILVLRALIRPRAIKRGAELPKVSMIVAAYNEASVIIQKLDNTFALDYPRTHLEVVVASDGSDDGTDALVANYQAAGLRLLSLPRQGKNLTLNAAVAAANGDILVFSDADTMLIADALRHLVAPFCDPEIGGVGGERRHIGKTTQAVGNRMLWRAKRSVKQLLSRAGSMTTAEGQLYAVRRSLFRPLPGDVNDDFFTASQVAAAHYRLVFEPRAAAYPFEGTTATSPFRPKVRIITRWLRAIWLMKRLLNPFEYGFYAIQLVSHKLLRRLVVVPLFVLGFSAPTLWRRSWIYKLVTLGQLGFHGAAVLGFLLKESRIGRLKILRRTLYWDMTNVAALIAIFNMLKGERYNIWTPQRTAPGATASEAQRSENRLIQKPNSEPVGTPAKNLNGAGLHELDVAIKASKGI